VTDGEKRLVFRILKEHFQAFMVVGFDLDGEKISYTDYETQIQGHALSAAVRAEVNEHAQAPEVYVRNLDTETDEGDEWKEPVA